MSETSQATVTPSRSTPPNRRVLLTKRKQADNAPVDQAFRLLKAAVFISRFDEGRVEAQVEAATSFMRCFAGKRNCDHLELLGKARDLARQNNLAKYAPRVMDILDLDPNKIEVPIE